MIFSEHQVCKSDLQQLFVILKFFPEEVEIMQKVWKQDEGKVSKVIIL